jgi:hypothetical protein
LHKYLSGEVIMAKLEERVTPTELLDAIRDGALKQELVKKYRTSDQELAMILLPLFRKGELTKEEFNDFFKGVPLRSHASEAESAPPDLTGLPTPPDLPPSQILRALSEVVENPVLAQEEPPVPPIAQESPRANKAGLSERHSSQEAALPQKETGPENAALSRPGLLLVSPRETGEEDAGACAVDSANMAGLLDMIFAKLSSIEDRLASIEKKISST